MTRRSVTSGAVSAAVAVALNTTGCAADQKTPVDDPDLTKQAAIKQTLTYLERTEAALPDGMALSTTSDAPGAVTQEGTMSGSRTCSSSDGANPDTDPQLAYVSYYVTGVPEGQTKKYVMQIRQLWESWGWTLTEEPDERRAAFANEDGFALDVRVAVSGSLAISIGGETPCITAENFTGDEEVPRQIGDTDS